MYCRIIQWKQRRLLWILALARLSALCHGLMIQWLLAWQSPLLSWKHCRQVLATVAHLRLSSLACALALSSNSFHLQGRESTMSLCLDYGWPGNSLLLLLSVRYAGMFLCFLSFDHICSPLLVPRTTFGASFVEHRELEHCLLLDGNLCLSS